MSAQPGPPPRALGVDFGKKRIGVAITDALGMLAHPVSTVANTGDERPIEAIAALAGEREAALIVVGLPLNMDGSKGPSYKAAKAFARRLRRIGLPVEGVDERLTTVDADERLRAAGVKDWRKRKQRIDQVSAALILEAWLRQRGERGRPST